MGTKELEVLQKMEKLNIHLSEEEILGYCKMFENNKDFLKLHQYAPIRKIVNYIRQSRLQKKKKEEHIVCQ